MRSFYRPRPKYQPRKYYDINYRINSPTLRVINDKGEQIGVLTKEEALRKAQDLELDLVLIAPKAQPPVAKIIDFKKFLYQEEKKAKEAKKGIKKSTTKDISLSLFIAQGDLTRLENKGKEFLKQGHQVRINLTLRGREMGKKQMAFDLMNRYIVSLGEVNVSKPPKQEGRVIRSVVAKRK
ncbi:MAG: translation initiation factor IF-3 [Candidatus Roizmanbacteria bacterium GW2011_GWC2_37_13]|uniref:Translation initiation factor IF-3 n=1 Tax=Candidatus Roizmanbacteria bacterium GW2011_GWC2_37_13 TaxID=1618486 RepID=A0A0G0G6P6_9BACT|nr:MAG: translation initiation factor IF-3 [Candidatus Roizmanbacteria bacterium GW2011_GWC1_37_12]KKQ25717.1 MAG: translation initiation factor IF-3 [Candidatus Roizmanbacteria bacterium GW2011_GWC2_37_13]